MAFPLGPHALHAVETKLRVVAIATNEGKEAIRLSPMDTTTNGDDACRWQGPVHACMHGA